LAGVPNVFGSATAPIPLSQLDQNFNTTLTIGSTSVGLGNTVTSLAGLANVTMTGNLTYGGVTLSNSVTGTGSMALSASPTFTGTLSSADHIITSTSANALAVGRQGTTNPVLNVDASTASVVTGLNIKGAAAAGGMAVSVTSSGTNENLTIDAKGSGTITINGTATGSVGIGSAPLSTSVSTRRDLTINGSSSGAILSFGNGGVRKGYITNDGTDMTVANETATGYLRFLTNSAEAARFDSSGYLLVGYTSSNGAYKLQVNSQIFATSSTIATSDARYKENVSPITGALDSIRALNPVQFDWKEHPVHNFDRSTPTVGFIAQEVRQALSDRPFLNSIVKKNNCVVQPELRDESGEIIEPAVTEEFLGIAEGNIVALLTAAVKELLNRVEVLEAGT
jgi:hypothetical protein